MNFQLTSLEKNELLRIARRSLEKPGWKPTIEELESPVLREGHACFVTLLESNGALRGCIGTLANDIPLGVGAAKYAHLAASQDPRFDPVKAAEVASLVIEMSVLGPHTPLKNLADLQIGTHGLIVENGMRKGVLLAKVATEYGWNHEEFLYYTCEKAGLDPQFSDSYDIRCFEELSFSEKDPV